MNQRLNWERREEHKQKRRTYRPAFSIWDLVSGLAAAGIAAVLLFSLWAGGKRDAVITGANRKAERVASAVALAFDEIPSEQLQKLPQELFLNGGTLGTVDLSIWLGTDFPGNVLVRLKDNRTAVEYVIWSEGTLPEGTKPPSVARQKDASRPLMGWYAPPARLGDVEGVSRRKQERTSSSASSSSAPKN